MQILKRVVVAGFIAFGLTHSAGAEKLDSKFLLSLRLVETGGEKNQGEKAKGDWDPLTRRFLARGPFQIHSNYFADAQRYEKSLKRFRWEDCDDYRVSAKVVEAYLNRYGESYIVGKDYEKLARIHNGGPFGYRNSATLPYWRKVERFLKKTVDSQK